MTPTNEQLAIINAALTGEDNLLLSALAGCAKTTTLELIMAKIPPTDALYLAFNKRTAEEAKAKLPSWVTVKTLNALGHAAWAKKTGRRRLEVSSSKLFDLARDMFEGDFKPTLRAVAMAKNLGVTNKRAQTSCAQWGDVECDDEFDLSDAKALLKISIEEAFAGNLDFNDQIYMSACYGGAFDKYPLVFVDEAQDLSPVNLEMLKRVIGKRLIVVGDAHQSIYAFRGADSKALERLKSQYSMLELPLTTNFRCSKAVVKYVNQTVPELNYCDGAADGEVIDLADASTLKFPADSAILCRNNAPLFKIGLSLIKQQQNITYFGSNAIQRSIKKMLAMLGSDDEDGLGNIATLESSLKRNYSEARIDTALDKLDCCKILLAGSTIGEAKRKLNQLCAKKTAEISLSTGHRAKGFEWENVYILDRHLIPSKYATSKEHLDQESNLLYVLCTRARVNLTFIASN